MAEIIEQNNASNVNNAAAAQQPNVGGLGNTAAPAPAMAMPKGVPSFSAIDAMSGWSSSSSSALSFCAALNKEAEKDENLRNYFHWGVIDIANDKGSAAYVAGSYNGNWLYGILFFERGASLRLVEQNNTQSYYSLTNLFTDEILKAISAKIMADHDLPNAYFLTINSLPEFGKVVDIEWTRQLLGQTLMAMYGRCPGVLGKLTLKRNDKFTMSVAMSDSTAMDSNGHPQRSDIVAVLDHQPSMSSDNSPTLMSDQAATAYPRVRSSAFVNLRLTGLKEAVAGEPQDMKQMQGELVITMMDNVESGSRAPLERQLMALAGYCKIASIGGWRDSFINTLDKRDRKFSALAKYLVWGSNEAVDVSKLDGNREAIESALNFFAPREAAVVISYRAGNGLAGLPSLLSEIGANRSLNALATLLAILDNMAPNAGDKVFSKLLASEFGVDAITCDHIIAAGVPSISGAYQGTGMMRSYQDADAVSVLTFLGDQQTDAYEYIRAQSYYTRRLEDSEQRLYMVKLLAGMYGAKEGRPTGESTDLCLNPIFCRALIKFVNAFTNYQVQGVNSYNGNDNVMFTAHKSQNLVVTAGGDNATIRTYGLGAATTTFKF